MKELPQPEFDIPVAKPIFKDASDMAMALFQPVYEGVHRMLKGYRLAIDLNVPAPKLPVWKRAKLHRKNMLRRHGKKLVVGLRRYA